MHGHSETDMCNVSVYAFYLYDDDDDDYDDVGGGVSQHLLWLLYFL